MLVDDEPDIVAVMKLGLKEFSVVGFTDPRSALDALKTNPEDFRILISDVRMPAMTGFELASAALDISPDIKIVLMTAFDINPEAFNKILPASKIAKFFTKPLELSALRAFVRGQYITEQDGGSSSSKTQDGGSQ
jgi:DNA-binding NtrC family response regulator